MTCAWFTVILLNEGQKRKAALCAFATAMFLLALLFSAGCCHMPLPPPDGPDTTQKWDSNGNANFGPAATCQ